jgi:orotidine-5'-phosphate decarboxylase
MTVEGALALAAELSPQHCRLKVGKELFTRAGPALVEQLQRRGFAVFLDLKFHDIPNTVAQACRAAADLGVWMVNVHALGGRRMLTAAREAIDAASSRPLLTAVTILTSHAASDLREIGLCGAPEEHVAALAQLACDAGLDGVVCSAQEAQRLRVQCGPDFVLVTPGIRPAGAAQGDQQRVVTPAQALAWGADYLVIGRPITASDNPARALLTIRADLG